MSDLNTPQQAQLSQSTQSTQSTQSSDQNIKTDLNVSNQQTQQVIDNTDGPLVQSMSDTNQTLKCQGCRLCCCLSLYLCSCMCFCPTKMQTACNNNCLFKIYPHIPFTYIR